MDFLWSLLLPRRHYRHFARLDQHGICMAFKHCVAQPQGSGWVEVTEARMSWMHQPLPSNARVSPRPRAITARQLLSI